MTTLSVDQIRNFVLAGHGDFDKVKAMLAEIPELLNTAYAWSETDHETAVMAASHVGNRVIAGYLLERGAPLAIYTAAMLGRRVEVESMLAMDEALINARGAHGIPLLAHAAFSGDTELMQMLIAKGAQEGISYALHNAVTFQREALVGWLLENTQPDLTWKNWQEKTALAVAVEQNSDAIAALLREHNAME